MTDRASLPGRVGGHSPGIGRCRPGRRAHGCECVAKCGSAFFGPGHPFLSRSSDGRQGRCCRSHRSRTSPPRQRSCREPLFLNNRYHDPLTSQFISVDPLVTTTGQPYIYGNANPTTYSDPDGLCPISGPGSAEACWAYASVDYTTTVHVTDELITVSTAGRPSVHHEREELRTAHIAGDEVFQELARGLDSLVSTVGEVSDDVADWSNSTTLMCLALAAGEKDSAPVGLGCAAVAQGIAGSATGTSVVVELYEDRNLSVCTTLDATHSFAVPGGLVGDLGTSWVREYLKQATGAALGASCSD